MGWINTECAKPTETGAYYILAWNDGGIEFEYIDNIGELDVLFNSQSTIKIIKWMIIESPYED